MRLHRGRAGFTLIELLVVLGVLGVLMAVLYPQISIFRLHSQIRECEALISNLSAVITEYNAEKGDYPPDRFADFDPKYRLASNKHNEGIEALVIALALYGTPGAQSFLQDLDAQGRLGNTDHDHAGAVIGHLGRRDQHEILDRWGNPLAYFHFRNYGDAQSVTMATGEVQIVLAVRDPRSGAFMEPRRFQILSAGPDEEFGTEDDIANFQMPRGR